LVLYLNFHEPPKEGSKKGVAWAVPSAYSAPRKKASVVFTSTGQKRKIPGG